MKRIILTIIALVAVVSNLLQAAEETNTKSFKVGKGGTLNVDLRAGEITILTWEKDEVFMKVTGLSNEAFKNLEINLQGNELTIRYENIHDDSEDEAVFTFTVPSKFNLDLKTLGGDISLKNNLDGKIVVDSYGGDIKTKNVNGALKIETKGGDIKLEDINGDCNAYTYGGDISINLVTGKNAKVTTNGGDINVKKAVYGIGAKTYGGDITINELGSDSELSTYGGDVSVGYAKGNIRMDTYGGNLELKTATGNIKGKTNGGDIIFKKIEGSVDIKTLSGTITVELSPTLNSESKISTSSGSVELTMPSSAKTIVEARIRVQGYWKNAKNNYSINSKFEPQSYNTDDSSREIVGIYNINGGGSKVYLRSVNDNIIIKKASK
jgi:DUF4097 and DUF4098 domain-containing protein YvlB